MIRSIQHKGSEEKNVATMKNTSLRIKRMFFFVANLKNCRETESLSQNQIFLCLYLFNLMVLTFNISNWDYLIQPNLKFEISKVFNIVFHIGIGTHSIKSLTLNHFKQSQLWATIQILLKVRWFVNLIGQISNTRWVLLLRWFSFNFLNFIS